MGLKDKVDNEIADITRQETELETRFLAQKKALATRKLLLLAASDKITPEVEVLLSALAINIEK